MDTKGLVRALGEESLLRHVGDTQHLCYSGQDYEQVELHLYTTELLLLCC